MFLLRVYLRVVRSTCLALWFRIRRLIHKSDRMHNFLGRSIQDMLVFFVAIRSTSTADGFRARVVARSYRMRLAILCRGFSALFLLSLVKSLFEVDAKLGPLCYDTDGSCC